MLIRPRLTDHYGVFAPQAKLPFAIPFVAEDIPLYVDPFLLWRSPAQLDISLHESLISTFGRIAHQGKRDPDSAAQILVALSECDEVGLGNSRTKKGKRISNAKALEIVDVFSRIPALAGGGLRHVEEIQLLVDGISKDRISDFSCNILKSFLIDFTIDESDRLGIPRHPAVLGTYYDPKRRALSSDYRCELPLSPITSDPVLFVPKRWLRYTPWINFDSYFKDYCPLDDVAHEGQPADRVKVLNYNREHYGGVEAYVAAREREASDCFADPLFDPIPILSAKRHYKKLQSLPTGKDNGADREYERIMGDVLPSMLYPQLDFATIQSRTVSGSSVRDLVFYNTQDTPFLRDMHQSYGSRQIVFELKNVAKLEREHVDQMSRYLSDDLGRFGVIVTRKRPEVARWRQIVDSWSAHRKAIAVLTDEDIDTMINVFESKQRTPLDVLSKSYFQLSQRFPT